MRISTIRIPCKALKEAEDFYCAKVGMVKAFVSVDEGYIEEYPCGSTDKTINEEDTK